MHIIDMVLYQNNLLKGDMGLGGLVLWGEHKICGNADVAQRPDLTDAFSIKRMRLVGGQLCLILDVEAVEVFCDLAALVVRAVDEDCVRVRAGRPVKSVCVRLLVVGKGNVRLEGVQVAIGQADEGDLRDVRAATAQCAAHRRPNRAKR